VSHLDDNRCSRDTCDGRCTILLERREREREQKKKRVTGKKIREVTYDREGKLPRPGEGEKSNRGEDGAGHDRKHKGRSENDTSVESPPLTPMARRD